MSTTRQEVRALEQSDGGRVLRLLDQRRLPGEEIWLELREIEPLAEAIETLTVRGAPAIGCAAAATCLATWAAAGGLRAWCAAVRPPGASSPSS